MGKIKETLHAKRVVTEEHIKQLEREGKEGVRYTAMMPDIPFLILGLICDVGWIVHLIAGIIYFCGNGFCYLSDWLALAALLLVMFGVVYIIYLNKINEKEIATKRQKDLGFGLTAFAGLAGGMIGIIQIVTYPETPAALFWIAAGGFLNFITGLPLYLSFKKGIVYGVQ